MKKAGFTLIETVLTIALLSILALVLAPSLGVSISQYNLIFARRQTVTSVRAGMERMVDEIRLIPGSAQVVSIGANNFQFQYPAGTSITYSLSANNLLRNSDVLVSNVTALTFSYYDEDQAITAIPANVRSVGIAITTSVPSTAGSFNLRTRVFITDTGNYYANFTSP